MTDLVDEQYMERALAEGRAAAERGEVPVGAVLVRDQAILATAGNRPIAMNDPTAHAEILAIRHAGERLGNYRLPGTTLYVTLEPCSMCIGALIHARVQRLVFGATDPKSGAAGGALDLARAPQHNHRLQVESGLYAEEGGALLRAFFSRRREELKGCG